MSPDASSYPFPTVARLALSLYASDRRVERLPTVREWLPAERVDLVHTIDHSGYGARVARMRLPVTSSEIWSDL